MTTCPAPGELIDQRLDRVLTQYRESPNLLFMIRSYLIATEEILLSICDLPSFFDIDNAVGDQLTILGKRLGWPREHCVCNVVPVFGFRCEGVASDYPIVGFCEAGTWLACGDFGIANVSIDDDELYRAFLRARRYQMLSLYDLNSLTSAIQEMYGPTATVLDAGHRRVVIAPGRDLTDIENALIQLVPRVLPVAPGIQTRFYYGSNLKVFGFGDGWGGFCEPLFPDGVLISSGGDDIEGMSDGSAIVTGPLTVGAPWMCEIDVKPYSC